MDVEKTEIPGILLIKPKVFGDSRGFFMETWHASRYAEYGIPSEFVQDNVSLSRNGVLRGLHFQNPNGQGKLVSVLAGEVFDVGVDIRRGSPTFGKWVGAYLSAENKHQFFIPAGFAHGFCVLSDEALFCYKCTAVFDGKAEHSILWNDPDLDIKWPLTDPTLSDRDKTARRLKDLPESILPSFT